MILPIVQVPDPILREVSKEIVEFTTVERRLAGNMVDTLRKHKGWGLSAVQVGVPLAIVAINPRCGIPFEVMINPKIIQYSGSMDSTEQCFSIDYGKGPLVKLRRHANVRVAFLDRAGNGFQVNCAKLPAIIMQHELDHLAGKMITDY